MNALSIIIPTCNDEESIMYLLRKIDETMHHANLMYEVIVVDDRSVDLTQSIVRKLRHTFPVKLFVKKGKGGKAQSILEGISYATYEIIATIDTNLAYPVQKISAMHTVLQQGYDIVIANRNYIDSIRSITHQTSQHIFQKLFQQKSIDIASGMKVFKKEIIERFSFNESLENFDIDFLVKAQNAGYRITTTSIPFQEYIVKRKKKHAIQQLWQLATYILTLKFAGQQTIPFPKKIQALKGPGFHYKGKEFIHFSHLDSSDSAFFRLTTTQKSIFLAGACMLLVVFFINWHATIVVLFFVLTSLYFSDLLFNLYLIIQSFRQPSEIHVDAVEIDTQHSWPTYTIFCPLYDEGDVLPQFIQAIEKLDYPKDKLQVILLLEEDDTLTQETAKRLSLPSYFSIRIPPQSFPKTKPKALNYGLQFATGEYCVVYDAEDIPDPLQLRKVVLAFKKSPENTRCMQAKLNFYNPYQNILTRVFTAEYSLWFDLVLTGLQATHAVIPLGGTSNHFRTKDLQAIQGWDSFNVTEDCDLGLRLAKHGFTTAIVNSTTLEEANSNFFNWFHQRGRWIKGYMQTYLVHARDPKSFIKHASIKQFITFQLVIGGKVMSLFINPLMWCITILYFSFRPITGHFIETFFPGPILYMGVLCLVFGNFLYLYYYMIGCAKKEQYSLIKYAFLVPLYWLGMSISGWYAMYKIIVEPYYWAKTKHGLHLKKEKHLHKKQQPLGIPTYTPQISV